MKELNCTTLFLPFLCRMLGYLPTPLAQCITCTEDKRPVAGLIYDHYNGASVCNHIWIAPGKRPSREWYAAIFDYSFNQLGVNKMVAQIAGSNDASIALVNHFGFVEEARIKDFSTDGDLIIYTLTKAQCRILNSPMWSKTTTKLRAA